jgi:predicted flap endonuclease-1-like 5' DNA nuclease
MAEELSVLESSASDENVEEITDSIDELQVDEDALTGTHLRSDLMDSAQTGAYMPARTSAPPPVPPEARQSRPPAVRSSVVPPPPRVPSHSGMFRIERPSSAPALPPPGASADPVTQPALSPQEIELRDTRAHLHRLRLMVRLREDRIRELETALREQTERVAALTRDLDGAKQKTQRAPDDLKLIAGIGPSFERGLHAAGINSFKQIAEWTADDIENVALKLRIVSKRIVRDRWVESARQLLEDEAALEQA